MIHTHAGQVIYPMGFPSSCQPAEENYFTFFNGWWSLMPDMIFWTCEHNVLNTALADWIG
jgi:hypothetical protein